MDKVAISLNINGRAIDMLVEPRKLLSDAIREDARLTGTHVGCEQGACGACTVLIDGKPPLLRTSPAKMDAIPPCNWPCTKNTACNADFARPASS